MTETLSMFDLIPGVLAPVVAVAIAVSSLSRFGYFIDDKIDEHYRSLLANNLRRMDNGTWTRSFLSIYDTIFRASQNGRPSAARSALASTIALAVVTVAWLVAQPGVLEFFSKTTGLRLEIVLVLSAFAIIVNVLGDYLSFWETRIVIGWMAKTDRRVIRSVLVVGDLVSSIVIYFVALTVAWVIIISVQIPLKTGEFDISTWARGLQVVVFKFPVQTVTTGYIYFLGEPVASNFYGVFFVTTMFTSIWLWTYVVGGILWRFLAVLAKVFDVEKHPVGAAMTIGSTVVGVVVVVISFLVAGFGLLP